MRKLLFLYALLAFLGVVHSYAQTVSPRQLPAKRTSGKVKIDGLLSDSAWKDASLLKDFVEFRPRSGVLEEHGVRTETYLMYDDEGIYFGGYCHEKTKDSISCELIGRDGFGIMIM